jgi:hypothetical protein
MNELVQQLRDAVVDIELAAKDPENDEWLASDDTMGVMQFAIHRLQDLEAELAGKRRKHQPG